MNNYEYKRGWLNLKPCTIVSHLGQEDGQQDRQENNPKLQPKKLDGLEIIINMERKVSNLTFPI